MTNTKVQSYFVIKESKDAEVGGPSNNKQHVELLQHFWGQCFFQDVAHQPHYTPKQAGEHAITVSE